MDKDIKNILNELYEIDSSLKDKEKELVKIIQKMIEIRPNVKIDEDFKEQLRNTIIEKITSQKLENYKNGNKLNLFHIFAYIFGWVWVLTFSFFIINNENFSKKETQMQYSVNNDVKWLLSFSNEIVKNWERSFWNLSWIWIDKQAKWWAMMEWKAESLSTETRSLWAVNDEVKVNEMASEKAVTPLLWSEWTSSVSKIDNSFMPTEPFVPEVYKYSFSWELNIDIPEKLEVYKKENSKISTKELVDNIKNVNFAWVDISKFQNLNIKNISINEDNEYWYLINIDFENNNLSIYKNWAKWPQVDYSVNNTNNNENLLKEDEIIKIAQDFLKTHNIDLSNYWAPRIEENYVNTLAKYESDKIMPDYYIQNTSVVFPLIIDWKEISEEYWQAKWVTIEIDLKEKKVASIYWINVSKYESSLYNIETNKNNILKIAEVWWRWGFNNIENEYDNVKYINKVLINPKLVYVNTYKYSNGVNEEYIIPAIVFDVKKDENDNSTYDQKVTIPLVKDLYKYDGSWNIVWSNE